VPRTYSQATLKRLFNMSGHYCAYPSCVTPIFAREGAEVALLGQIAHIEGLSDEGPRSNPGLTLAERNSYSNLVVLCPTHHVLVDSLDSLFDVATVQGWKTDAERSTAERLSVGSLDISFTELALVCDALASGYTGIPSTEMVAVQVEEKMAANGLTDAINIWMTTGLGQAPMVADFIARQAQISTRYPERLRAGFVAEYDRLRDDGISGDDLFLALIDFGKEAILTPQADQHRIWVATSAAVAVVAHLFEICDLFEVPA
jgi:hypothetical protein